MEIILLVIYWIVAITVALWPLAMVIYKKRVLCEPYDKSIVYLAAEIAYAPEKWKSVKKRIEDEKQKRIPVPFISTWRCMIGQPFKSFENIGSIWFGLICIGMAIMFLISKDNQKLYSLGFVDFLVILVMGVGWFIYYFRSFSADISENLLKSDIAMGYLVDLGWGEIDKDIICTIKEEVKVDFDLFKKESSLAGFLLALVVSSLIIYSRFNNLLTPGEIGVILFLFSSIFISKWLYEGYRTRIIYISLNALLGLIKNAQLKDANQALQLTAGSAVRF
jgi:hypothetical protein